MFIPAQALISLAIGSAIDRDPLVLSPDMMAIEIITRISSLYAGYRQLPTSCVQLEERGRVVGTLTEAIVWGKPTHLSSYSTEG